MSRDGLNINGLDTMQKKLNYISTRYPYESEVLLSKMGNKFRNSVKKKTFDSGYESKRKLMKSYRGSKVQGAGKDLYVEFRSTSPHFHLVERGHKIVDKNDRDTGKRVQGKFFNTTESLKNYGVMQELKAAFGQVLSVDNRKFTIQETNTEKVGEDE